MIREGDIGEKLFPDLPDMKVDFSEIGIGKIGKIGLAPPPPPQKFYLSGTGVGTIRTDKISRLCSMLLVHKKVTLSLPLGVVVFL